MSVFEGASDDHALTNMTGHKAKSETEEGDDVDEEQAVKKLKAESEENGGEVDAEGSEEMFGATLS